MQEPEDVIIVSKENPGRENGELVLMHMEFQFAKIKKVLEIDGDDGCTTMRIYLMPFKMVKMVSYMLCIFYHNLKKQNPKNIPIYNLGILKPHCFFHRLGWKTIGIIVHRHILYDLLTCYHFKEL